MSFRKSARTKLVDNFWPPPEAVMDISGANQLTDGLARCTFVAVCDEHGQPLRNFYLGQPAHFFYEFEILSEIDAAGGGVEIVDSTGRIIHGKNAFQYCIPLSALARPGARIRYHQVIHLELGAGEYTFSVTLASVNGDLYARYCNGRVADHLFRTEIQEHCRVQHVGSFTVDYHPTEKLLHHGMTNLPGCVEVAVIKAIVDVPREQTERTLGPHRMLGWRANMTWLAGILRSGDDRAGAGTVAPTMSARATVHGNHNNESEDVPTIFHVTHWKAGSQWIYKILHYCAPDRIAEPQVGDIQFLNWPLESGKVYPTVYVTKQQFDTVTLPKNTRRFVVIRDLRDTLISAYFSIKVSHTIQTWMQEYQRTALQSLSLEDGLIFLLDDWLTGCARIQMSWLEADEPVLRYEDLLEHDLDILERVLLEECQLPVAREVFHKAVLANRFEKLTHGRARGQEKVTAHIRKGIAGDWRNYFTDRVTRAFKMRYGGLLIASGYEKDLNW